MRKMNIVFITDRKFSNRDFNRYGVWELSDKFKVWVLDCSLIINEKQALKDNNPQFKKRIDFNNYITVANFRSIIDYLERHPTYFYIDLLNTASFLIIKIRRILHAKGVHRIKLCLGELPLIDSINTPLARFKNAAMRGKLHQKIFNYIVRRLFSRFFEPGVDIAVFSGDICSKRYPRLSQHIIWAHSLDYEIYRYYSQVESQDESDKRYAVFLDQNAPAHPDYGFHGNKPPVTQKNYYSSLNKFFDDFEKQTGLEVIIAGHPRSEVRDGRFWCGRNFVLKKTPQLVREAELVFVHYSTAISFAVMWRKPIVQLVTGEYVKSYRWNRFTAFSALLNLTVLNTDDYESIELLDNDVRLLDEAMYDRYEREFLKSQYSESKGLWDIIGDGLYQYFNAKNLASELI